MCATAARLVEQSKNEEFMSADAIFTWLEKLYRVSIVTEAGESRVGVPRVNEKSGLLDYTWYRGSTVRDAFAQAMVDIHVK